MQPVRVYGGSSGPSGSPVLGGIIAGVLLAVVWMLLVWLTHNPVSLAGWGVGGLIGLAVASGARKARGSNPSLGTAAALLTVGTVVLAKTLILAFALGPIVRDEIVRDRDATTAMYSDSLLARQGFLPRLGRLFSIWDLLWLGLGVSSAWKLAQSRFA